jgi:SHS2 domain-containing protein
MKYKYLKHTSEAKFKAYGKNIEEVFRNCALAMFNILGDTDKVKCVKKKKIKIKARDYISLLYDFLSELLYVFETERVFIHDVKDIKISKDFELSATIVGDDPGNYELSGDIKAVTYNDMAIKKTSKGYEAVVVVDV